MNYKGFTIHYDGKHWVILEGKTCQWFTDTLTDAKHYINDLLWTRENVPF